MTAEPEGAAQADGAAQAEGVAPAEGAAESGEARRARRRLIAEAKQSLRELRIELAILNHRVGSRSEVKDTDFDCLDVISRLGPISPTALAHRTGVHLATMTGILDRLERDGWIVRARDSRDRRAVTVHGVPDKQRDIIRLYEGMNSLLDGILESYTDDQIDLIVGFLRRCAEAGQAAADRLAKDPEG
jgi:DNA-binding MarR family transcriptional regulator